MALALIALFASSALLGPPAALRSIRAAPAPSHSAFDLAEALTGSSALPAAAWRQSLRALVTDPAFFSDGWARAPFKLDERWPFAIDAYTMADVERDVTRLPPMFVAHGVRHEGGIYNSPMAEGFGYEAVAAAMEGATVVLLNAGFLIPKLAAVSLAMLEATLLPIWLNVYLSRPGLARSTQLHTDLQDVLLVQCSGRKRWRVYAPPEPAAAPGLSPFARGKGTDLAWAPGELLLDCAMGPGEVLYIPAGFPHETDTLSLPSAAEGGEGGVLRDGSGADEYSVHLTIGVDTHLWGLNYATLREQALRSAGQTPFLASQAPLTTLPLAQWAPLHEPLPLGFLAAPLVSHFAPLGASAASADLAAARSELVGQIASQAAKRMLAAEPGRWGAGVDGGGCGGGSEGVDDGGAGGGGGAPGVEGATAADLAVVAEEALVRELGLVEVSSRFVTHHAAVLAAQEAVYRRAAHEPPTGIAPSARARGAAIESLFGAMDRLDELMAALTTGAAPPLAAAAAAAAPAGAAVGAGDSAGGFGAAAKAGGFGGGGAKPAKKVGKAKAKRR